MKHIHNLNSGKVFPLLAFVFISLFGYSQTPQKLTDAVQSCTSEGNTEEANRLESLIHNLQPTIYIRGGNTTNSQEGTSPLVVNTDASSINKLYDNNSLYNSVELICLKIESAGDLNALLDCSRLSGFDGLKYIYVLYTFSICEGVDCEVSAVSKVIVNNNNYKLVYSINISE